MKDHDLRSFNLTEIARIFMDDESQVVSFLRKAILAFLKSGLSYNCRITDVDFKEKLIRISNALKAYFKVKNLNPFISAFANCPVTFSLDLKSSNYITFEKINYINNIYIDYDSDFDSERKDVYGIKVSFNDKDNGVYLHSLIYNLLDNKVIFATINNTCFDFNTEEEDFILDVTKEEYDDIIAMTGLSIEELEIKEVINSKKLTKPKSSSSSSSKHTDKHDVDSRPSWATHNGASYHDLGHCYVWDEKEGRAIQIY